MKNYKNIIKGSFLGIAVLFVSLYNINTSHVKSKGIFANNSNLANIQLMQASAGEIFICQAQNSTSCTMTTSDGTRGYSYGPLMFY